MQSKKIKLVISDCHLSAGQNFEQEKNPHEDFFFDDEMVAFFEYFSTGKYGEGCEVELIINGDFLDFLNVPYQGEFEESITEEFAIYKLECILKGHPAVFNTLRRFVGLPGKTLIFNIGNHDAELFFPRVAEHLVQFLDPQGLYPSSKVSVNQKTPGLLFPGGVYIEHGNQYEAVHYYDYASPFITEGMEKPILSLPWGSYFVLKIVNRFKWEREYVDKVRPIKAMILWGLFFDTWFTLKFVFLSVFYFMKTRFVFSPEKKSMLKNTFRILQQETTTFLQDLEADAKSFLEERADISTVIMGHSHHPMFRTYAENKTYINTGTWTKMINLDLRGLGGGYKLLFALIEYDENDHPTSKLVQWEGEYKPYRAFTI